MSSLTYDQWVRKATTEAVPPTSDGLLHFGERAALVEQLSSPRRASLNGNRSDALRPQVPQEAQRAARQAAARGTRGRADTPFGRLV